MIKEKILQTFEDINYVYNDCTRYDTLKQMLDELQEPKTGYWIKESPFLMSKCSECGNKAFGNHGFDEVLKEFCPKCGAKMAESEK